MCDIHKIRLLDTFSGRLRLEGRVTTRTALHVGAGGSGDPLATDLPVVRDAAGRPMIPGASLKGVLRSAAEALFRGGEIRKDVAKDKKLWACDPLNSPCVTHDVLKNLSDDHQNDEDAEKKIAEAVWRKSCTICRLFGSLALAGRVRFPDLLVSEKAYLPFEIRNGVAIERDKELALKGALYDFEAVPPGTEFKLTVIVDNPVDAEAGLLLYLFEELDAGHLALGGKSSRGLGQVGVTWDRMIETSIRGGNPFRSLLEEKNLLEPVEVVEEIQEEDDEKAFPLPTTGKAEDWELLARLIRELPEIEKGALARTAAEEGLTKKQLNERLGLGIDHPRKAWDTALDRLVECGFLERHEGELILAGSAPEALAEEAETPSERPALDAIYQRYIGAMAELWEESFQCSPNN